MSDDTIVIPAIKEPEAPAEPTLPTDETHNE